MEWHSVDDAMPHCYEMWSCTMRSDPVIMCSAAGMMMTGYLEVTRLDDNGDFLEPEGYELQWYEHGRDRYTFKPMFWCELPPDPIP